MRTVCPMETVKYRTVSINVYPVTIDGKESWRFETMENGKRKYVTRSTLAKAKKALLVARLVGCPLCDQNPFFGCGNKRL